MGRQKNIPAVLEPVNGGNDWLPVTHGTKKPGRRSFVQGLNLNLAVQAKNSGRDFLAAGNTVMGIEQIQDSLPQTFEHSFS